MSDAFLRWLEVAGKHWDTVRPEDVMRELGREPMETVGADMVAFMREAPKRIQELEAQCAAMREALEQVRETAEHSRRAESKGSAPYTVEFFLACLDRLDAALATDAGKAMLERLDKPYQLASHEMEATAREAAESMRERCAKAAEDYEAELYDHPMATTGNIAAVIRALPLEET